MSDGLSRIAVRMDDYQSSVIGNLLSDLAGTISLVGYDIEYFMIPPRKRVHHLAVMQISTAGSQSQWTSISFCQFPFFGLAAPR